MNVKDISISKGMTINLGNYSSHRVEVSLTASFDKDDDIDGGMEKLTTMVNKKLAKEVKAFTDEHEAAKPARQPLMEQVEDDEYA